MFSRAGARRVVAGWGLLSSMALAQLPATPVGAPDSPEDALPPPSERVVVKPVAADEEISRRVSKVLVATGWYVDPQVRVQDGVVFLRGGARSVELKNWAGELARNTQDVAAVANQLEIVDPPMFDAEPVLDSLRSLWRDVLTALPFVGLALLVMGLSLAVGLLTTRVARRFLRDRIRARLLRNVVAGGVGALVFLSGLYVILRVSGLTQLALTVVGGTGLLGLVVGIAFRDITENFLASIFLSVQRPFETGDLVEVSAVTGYVQQLNLRVTILMTLEGNLVQIPNATVYKSNVRNFTANTNRREDFVVGIGYEQSISDAQATAMSVLLAHPAVLETPAPQVLVDDLGRATVNLRVYFWLNGREHSWLKVRSSVIRMVKRGFQQKGISMPDEAREVIFPKGLAITLGEEAASPKTQEAPEADDEGSSRQAEAGLSSEAGTLERQAAKTTPLIDEENLLKNPR
ncbi:MAG: mechanosensitive ion channel family protein [Archangium sp.]|nr:mechanosensitive ion channel family protein [Archangium sp.]MDP3152590.1 mechanosensitive ion channel family protein [Archangium sp.]MDP3571010.1 mechanosensitive ion channel family protein [Archangium sp.]